MAFATIHYQSRSLQKASAFNIIFPEDANLPRPWATFYLLHGLSDDHTIWHRRTSIERYVAGMPLVVVMPDGGRGWYSNAQEGYAYEDDLIKDVVGLVERTFPVKAERSGRAIGGLSMGGYGALKLALKYPEMFCSANSHSGAAGFPPPERRPTGSRDQPRVRADLRQDPRERSRRPVRRSSQRWTTGGSRRSGSTAAPKTFCSARTEAFHAHLDKLKVDHEYQEFPGTTTGLTGIFMSSKPSRFTRRT